MAKQKMSVTFRVDKGVLGHNNREFIAKNVDREKVADNITYKHEDLRETYHQIFDKALAEYNAKQKRADRRIDDYYSHIENSKQEKLFYEAVVQIGDKDNCGIGKENFDAAKKMLDEYMKAFEERNPNIKVFNAVMHLDEATPHLHIDFVPVCYNQTRGLSTRVSMKKALEQQGISAKSKKLSEWATWADSEKKEIAAILRKYGFARDVKGAHYSHMTVDEYKNARQRVEEINAHVNAYKAKPVETLTPEEVTLIKSQNDFMRSEIQKRDEKIRILSKRAGAKFVPFEVYSPDKFAFISDELQRSNIPFVDESNTLYVPEWAYITCSAIAAKYRFPEKSSGVHEGIKLDIDTLVYSCESFEDLLSKLKEKGYEIKEGKYLAVKSPAAQRFVRLKTLGEEYLPKNIENRIANRDKFARAVQAKSAKANETEQRFYTTITQTIIAVRTFKFRPQKTNPKKIYSFENDREINFLSEQLLTMHEFNLSNPSEIYAVAEETQKKISEKLEKIKQLSDDIPTLKSDIAQLKFFFSFDKNSRLDTMAQIKYAAAKQIADKYGITSPDEIESLEKRVRLSPMYISSLKTEVSDEQLKAKKISDLIHTYEKIVQGNYIDNLIAADKERAAKQENKSH